MYVFVEGFLFLLCFYIPSCGLGALDYHRNRNNFWNCVQLPEEGQKWGFLIWLLFSYCGFVCLAGICIGMVLTDMVRVPDWALEAAGRELEGYAEMQLHTNLDRT